jgi:hypothetical protein
MYHVSRVQVYNVIAQLEFDSHHLILDIDDLLVSGTALLELERPTTSAEVVRNRSVRAHFSLRPFDEVCTQDNVHG